MEEVTENTAIVDARPVRRRRRDKLRRMMGRKDRVEGTSRWRRLFRQSESQPLGDAEATDEPKRTHFWTRRLRRSKGAVRSLPVAKREDVVGDTDPSDAQGEDSKPSRPTCNIDSDLSPSPPKPKNSRLKKTRTGGKKKVKVVVPTAPKDPARNVLTSGFVLMVILVGMVIGGCCGLVFQSFARNSILVVVSCYVMYNLMCLESWQSSSSSWGLSSTQAPQASFALSAMVIVLQLLDLGIEACRGRNVPVWHSSSVEREEARGTVPTVEACRVEDAAHLAPDIPSQHNSALRKVRPVTENGSKPPSWRRTY